MSGLNPAFSGEDHILDLTWSSCGSWLAAAEVSGPIHCLQAGQLCRTWPGHALGTTSLAWKPDQTLLASCGQDGFVRFWEADAESAVRTSPAPDRWSTRLAWHRKGKWLAVAGGRQVAFYQEDGSLDSTTEAHCSTLSDLAWMSHDLTCITAGYQGLQTWSPGKNKPWQRYHWQGSSVRLAVSPNQHFIATGDQDRTVHFWRRKKPSSDDSAMMSGFAGKVEQLSWDSESRYLATGGSSDVCLWDCLLPGPEGREPRVLKGNPEAFITAVAFQPKGPWLASGNEVGELCLWRPLHEKEPVWQWKLESSISALAWSPRGERLAIGCAEGQIYVLDDPGWGSLAARPTI